jgi:hypothetical protein
MAWFGDLRTMPRAQRQLVRDVRILGALIPGSQRVLGGRVLEACEITGPLLLPG